jgi:hypothetical protein
MFEIPRLAIKANKIIKKDIKPKVSLNLIFIRASFHFFCRKISLRFMGLCFLMGKSLPIGIGKYKLSMIN